MKKCDRRIRVKDGNSIETIKPDKVVRGHRLSHVDYCDSPSISDEEFNKDVEPFCRQAKFISETRTDIVSFVEKAYGIRLLPYQKVILKFLSNGYELKDRIFKSDWKLKNYIRICMYYINMKKDDVVGIISPDGCKRVSREEFGEYLNRYLEY